MKIYSLQFIAVEDGSAERIWHSNRRALERYSRTLRGTAFDVLSIEAFDLPSPLTEARLVSFLNAHCSDFMPTGSRKGSPSRRRGEDIGAP